MEEGIVMTAVLEERSRLAAPRRLCPVPPMLLQGAGWLPDEWSLDSEADVPAFLRQARLLVERHPTSPAALARLAQAELACDHRTEAADSARAALKQNSTAPDLSAAVSSAVTLMACGQVGEAESALAEMTLEGPLVVLHAAAAAQRGDFVEALRRLGSEDSASTWSLRAWIYLEIGDHGRSVHSYREVLRSAGPSPETLTNLGLAHAFLGETKRAISATRQALRLGPSQRTRVGLNLAWYELASGEAGLALAVLEDLKRSRPHDIEPVFAEAGVHFAAGNDQVALRVLRRARTSLWAYATTVQQAELTVNLAVVRWRLGQQSRSQAAATTVAELDRIGYESLRIAAMLPFLLPSFSDVGLFRRIFARLRTAHPDASLHNLEVHLAILERRFTDASDSAVAWAKESPLDADAATAATYLLAAAQGDNAQAVELGMRALRRMPAAARLANNVAYALALEGRVKEARRYLPDVEAPQHMATFGLLELLSGRIAEARRAYLRAHDMAIENGDPMLAKLVLLNAHLAFTQFASDVQLPDVDEPSTDDLAAKDDPRLALTMCTMERYRAPGIARDRRPS